MSNEEFRAGRDREAPEITQERYGSGSSLFSGGQIRLKVESMKLSLFSSSKACPGSGAGCGALRSAGGFSGRGEAVRRPGRAIDRFDNFDNQHKPKTTRLHRQKTPLRRRRPHDSIRQARPSGPRAADNIEVDDIRSQFATRARGEDEVRKPGRAAPPSGPRPQDQAGFCGLRPNCGRWRSNWPPCALRRLIRA